MLTTQLSDSICYHHAQTPGRCRFGAKCKRKHADESSAEYKAWLENTDEQEKYAAFLEKGKAAAQARKKKEEASPGNKAGTGRKSSVSFKSVNVVELESVASSTGIQSSGRVYLSAMVEAYPVELDAMSAELSGLAAQVRS